MPTWDQLKERLLNLFTGCTEYELREKQLYVSILKNDVAEWQRKLREYNENESLWRAKYRASVNEDLRTKYEKDHSALLVNYAELKAEYARQTAVLKQCRAILRANTLGHEYPGANAEAEGAKIIQRGCPSPLLADLDEWKGYALRLEIRLAKEGIDCSNIPQPRSSEFNSGAETEYDSLRDDIATQNIKASKSVFPKPYPQPAIGVNDVLAKKMDDSRPKDNSFWKAHNDSLREGEAI